MTFCNTLNFRYGFTLDFLLIQSRLIPCLVCIWRVRSLCALSLARKLHPVMVDTQLVSKKKKRSLIYLLSFYRKKSSVCMGNSMICSNIWHKDTSDISKLFHIISQVIRRVKFGTILKYGEWNLCQISRTNPAITCFYHNLRNSVM